MPYSKSKARINFENNLVKLKSLSKIASLKKSKISYAHQELIYQSAIFLLSASIEEYLKTFIEDLIFNYKNNSSLFKNLPENFRTLTILNNHNDIFKNYNFTGDEIKTLKTLKINSSHFDVIFDNKLLSNQITAKLILGTKKYPSTKNLKVLYNRLGIEDILKEIHKKGRKDYTGQLESFLSVREAISHQSPPSLTIIDIERHFTNIKDLVNQMDRVKYSHITKISGAQYWPC